jgi:hypothetical protein
MEKLRLGLRIHFIVESITLLSALLAICTTGLNPRSTKSGSVSSKGSLMALILLFRIGESMVFLGQEAVPITGGTIERSRASLVASRRAAREMAIRSGDIRMLVAMSRQLIQESDKTIASFGTLATPQKDL